LGLSLFSQQQERWVKGVTDYHALFLSSERSKDMSCYEWEQGEIIIPSKVWADTKKRIRDAYNRWVETEFAAARAFYERFKGKKQPKEYGSPESDAWDEGKFRFSKLFYHATKRDERGFVIPLDSPRAPRRSDYPLANTRTTSFDVYGEEFGFGFNNEKRTVGWEVGENNRACENARKHPLARELFRILDSIEYTRGTGGKIVGNDEYNRDSRHDGGGGNYVKDEFGPNIKKAKPMSQRLAGGYRW
jgi:hypothetical protein